MTSTVAIQSPPAACAPGIAGTQRFLKTMKTQFWVKFGTSTKSTGGSGVLYVVERHATDLDKEGRTVVEAIPLARVAAGLEKLTCPKAKANQKGNLAVSVWETQRIRMETS